MSFGGIDRYIMIRTCHALSKYFIKVRMHKINCHGMSSNAITINFERRNK